MNSPSLPVLILILTLLARYRYIRPFKSYMRDEPIIKTQCISMIPVVHDACMHGILRSMLSMTTEKLPLTE